MPQRPTIPVVPILADDLPASMQRRRFLQRMAASMALAGAGCSGPPPESILPYVRMPETMVPGEPRYYATALTRRGLALGVLVESESGRPIKVEGNTLHPASLGATDTFAQAAVLQLWDPERSAMPRRMGVPASWDAFRGELAQRRLAWQDDEGAGLRILTGPLASPTLHAQVRALLRQYPRARWHCYDPLDDGGTARAATLAFGRPLDVVPRVARAATIVSCDADLIGDWPGSVRHARDFMHERRASAPRFERRLYALEASPSLTGAVADNRVALAPYDIERLLWRLARRLGVAGVPADVPAPTVAQAVRWEAVLADRLAATRGASLLAAGGSLSAPTRALVHRINAELGNFGATLDAIAPVRAGMQEEAGSLTALVEAMHAGAVHTLLMIDCNPVYDGGGAIDVARGLEQVPYTVHHGLYCDETAQACRWHLPLAHALEQWSDARAYDGTAAIVQPLVRPLYGGRSAHALLAMAAGEDDRDERERVRASWRQRRGTRDFEAWWSEVLQRGLIEASAAPAVDPGPVALPAPPAFAAPPLVACFTADAAADVGQFANNAWLQELPRPLTGMTWDNAALIGAGTARALGVRTGDMLRLATAGTARTVEAPVWVMTRHADGVITLPLGYGRRAAGRVGNGVGFDAYPLKTVDAAPPLRAARVSGQHAFAVIQHETDMASRPLVRAATAETFRRHPAFATAEKRARTPETSLYPPWPQAKEGGHRWGMAIDLNACIGCHACTVACQAENNIPVVGKEEVARGRAMHWLRVDRYESGVPLAEEDGTAARAVFQPVPCMHCETAPCEAVCPVGATVHDSDGLNVQVYNRCVGTRFCSNNCPYKVRRFNFLSYTDTPLDRPPPAQNPEVTVRRGGVMEKCTYCVQRITRARIAAEKDGRPLRDGAVVTACEAVCPTGAIVFGDLNDAGSRVARAKASPLDYAMLAELNTRPRTTYAALVLNPDAALRMGEGTDDEPAEGPVAGGGSDATGEPGGGHG